MAFGKNSQKITKIVVKIIAAINAPRSLLFGPPMLTPIKVTIEEARILTTLFPNKIEEIEFEKNFQRILLCRKVRIKGLMTRTII